MKTTLSAILLPTMLVLSINVSAQILSLQEIQAEVGTEVELKVNLNCITANTTALQFNLHLPEGTVLDEKKITKGEAASNHELVIRPLESGDRLFVLYNLEFGLLQDGELLRLPVTLPQAPGTLQGSLSLFRTATTDAVSHTGEDTAFRITALQCGDVNADGEVTINDVTSLVNIILGKGENKPIADVNRDGETAITDVTALINIILGK